MLTMKNLEICFEQAKEQGAEYVAVAVKIQGSEESEIIINKKNNFDSKLAYYKQAYDDSLRHKHAANISIAGFTFGDSFQEIEDDFFH